MSLKVGINSAFPGTSFSTEMAVVHFKTAQLGGCRSGMDLGSSEGTQNAELFRDDCDLLSCVNSYSWEGFIFWRPQKDNI